MFLTFDVSMFPCSASPCVICGSSRPVWPGPPTVRIMQTHAHASVGCCTESRGYNTRMSQTLAQVQKLVAVGKIRISDHGYDELAADGILVGEVIAGVATAIVVEDYPDYYKGPCVLVLQDDAIGHPIHAVWGIAKGRDEPAVLITAYRPDAENWTADFRRRKP